MHKRPRVLVVDDDPGIRETMGDILVLEGFSVEVAPDGERAVALCSRQAFDFALLDIRMPGMDGIETLQALKAVLPELRVVMITGFEAGDLARRAIEAGAEAVFRKPLDVASFLPLLMVPMSLNE
ncbi:MAG: response regulator [Anaerolineae bacterium]|nr:response regulator [Anaerolineae bacterium]